MAGQGKGAVRRSKNIVGGGGTTLFLAGVAVGCVLTWSTQRPESIPNPLRASYQNQSDGAEAAFPPSPTYEFYSVLPERGVDSVSESKPEGSALDAAAKGETKEEDPKNEDKSEEVAAAESPEKIAQAADLSASDPSVSQPSASGVEASTVEPLTVETSTVEASKPALAEAVSVASKQDEKDDPSPTPTPSQEPSQEVEVVSIRSPKDAIPDPTRPSRYVIQVGSFRERGKVEKTKAELILMGFRVMVQSMSIDGGAPWHRIRVGPYDDLSQTERARARLESEGFRTIVLKGQRG